MFIGLWRRCTSAFMRAPGHLATRDPRPIVATICTAALNGATSTSSSDESRTLCFALLLDLASTAKGRTALREADRRLRSSLQRREARR